MTEIGITHIMVYVGWRTKTKTKILLCVVVMEKMFIEFVQRMVTQQYA